MLLSQHTYRLRQGTLPITYTGRLFRFYRFQGFYGDELLSSASQIYLGLSQPTDRSPIRFFPGDITYLSITGCLFRFCRFWGFNGDKQTFLSLSSTASLSSVIGTNKHFLRLPPSYHLWLRQTSIFCVSHIDIFCTYILWVYTSPSRCALSSWHGFIHTIYCQRVPLHQLD